jgi:hypothetical protein
MNPSTSANSTIPKGQTAEFKPFDAVLTAIRELEFGTVEVIVHQGEIREIRQIRKKRFEPSPVRPVA